MQQHQDNTSIEAEASIVEPLEYPTVQLTYDIMTKKKNGTIV